MKGNPSNPSEALKRVCDQCNAEVPGSAEIALLEVEGRPSVGSFCGVLVDLRGVNKDKPVIGNGGIRDVQAL